MIGHLAIVALSRVSTGTPYAEVFASVNDITDETKGYLQCLRGIIVDMSDGRLQLRDGEESASFDDVVANPDHDIETMGMWRMVTLDPHGYVGNDQMELMAEYFGLDGFRIVRARGDGTLIPCDGNGPLLGKRDVNLVLYDGYGHFKALVPEIPEVPEDVMAEVGVSTEDAGGATDAGDGGDEWRVVGKNGRVMAGGGGGGETSSPVDEVRTCQDSSLLRFSSGNQFSALRGEEDAEDEMEDGAETEDETGEGLCTEVETDEVAETDEVVDEVADEVAETDEVAVAVAVEDHISAFARVISFFFSVVFGVTVFIFAWIGVVLTVSPAPAPAPADDVGQCPTRRNRSGRRMAGRHRARPGRGRGGKKYTKHGRGGSKYLKRGPARSGRVHRKRGRGRGHGPQSRVGCTFVRGGAKSSDGKVCMSQFIFLLYRCCLFCHYLPPVDFGDLSHV